MKIAKVLKKFVSVRTLLAALMIVSLCCFAACDDDDDEEEKSEGDDDSDKSIVLNCRTEGSREILTFSDVENAGATISYIIECEA